jgi:hypothetical protein
MFEARERRPGCQGIIVRQAGCAKLALRIVTQAVRSVAVFAAAAHLVDALPQKIVIRMADVALMAAVRQCCSEALGQANLKVDATQQNRTEIGRPVVAGAVGVNAMSDLDAKRSGDGVEFMPGKV